MDEADAALAIVEAGATRNTPTDDDWRRLFDSEGYRALKEREGYIGRAFTDSSFRAFLLSDSLIGRRAALGVAVDRYRGIELHRAARAALAYLPPGTPLSARLLPMIKPRTNSFVFTTDSIRRIFKYVDPAESSAQIENTLAHELHHIGFSTACPSGRRIGRGLSPAIHTLRVRLHGFGEGLAMLAAAGSPRVHPHHHDSDSVKARWDRDVANAATDIRTLESFVRDVLQGRLVDPDAIAARAATFYGIQGPWYTVGWLMASTVELHQGRDELLRVICDPVALMRSYNAAAARQPGPRTAHWSPVLLDSLRSAIAVGVDSVRE